MNSQSDFYSGIRGPAVDSLFETLGLAVPKSQNSVVSEEQLDLYLIEFEEFIRAQSWQSERFFGFIHALTDDQLLLLVQQETAQVGGLILKLLDPLRSAGLLKSLNPNRRSELIASTHHVAMLSSEEMIHLEASVRESAKRLPRVSSRYAQKDEQFWGNVLSHFENSDEILSELERFRPGASPGLARFRYQLEDLVDFQGSSVASALDQTENEELAMALAVCTPETRASVLKQLDAKRRAVLEDQVIAVQGLSRAQLMVAKQTLTARLREMVSE